MITLPSTLPRIVARQRAQADKLRAQHGIDPQPWYRITNQADPDEAEVMLYDDIGGWYGATADQFIADLRGITAPNLRVRINSPGGSVFEGIAIANALRSHPANVTIQVDGIAASIASLIAMAGDRIEMAPNTMMMIHDASGLCMGNASDMEEMAELLDLISDNIADAYSARAGGTREDWRERMRAETWYLPKDAVDAGLADEATQAPKTGTPAAAPAEDDPEPDMHRPYDLAAYGYAGPQQAAAALTEDIRSLVGDEVAAALRAQVAEPVPAPAEGTVPAEPTPVVAEHQPAEAAPDEWAAAVAHLMRSAPSPWAALTAHLTKTPTSSSAATDA
ncbi:head maturation protease, ClpP-related [Streptomyces sp. H27-C3]|uniref:head maturation protease, ClpP-related n=1 Tax=Streptomyces sp. H27-C3 TaxID=3046305 RepID=UPI0024B979B3|nr:head maturation protease, ClpP-related [Streptomyces sp. H27-C3]MDJ0460592.1 ATP-dependent Clp protease proteolytic subunit [Streptomyces sp. H27-C3]